MSIEQSGGRTADLTIQRRLGTAPSERGACSAGGQCPDVFELASGDFAIIGADVSLDLDLPADAGRSETERTVVVPRAVLLAAMRDLSDCV
jgi:hypothetical protein